MLFVNCKYLRFVAIAWLVSPLMGQLGCVKIPKADAPYARKATPAPTEQLLWTAASPDKLYRIGEVRAFEIFRNGDKVGTAYGRYDGPLPDHPQRHRFSTRVELTLGLAKPLRSAGEIIIDQNGNLVQGFERSSAAELQFIREGDVLVFTTGNQREEITYRDGTAYMAVWSIFHEELVLGLRTLNAGSLQWRRVNLSGSLPSEWSATLSVDDLQAGVKGILQTNLGQTIHLQHRRIEAIEITDEDIEIKANANLSWPTWEVVAPAELRYQMPANASFERRELELPGRPGQPKLMGEVLLPKQRKTPAPAVLFVSGTGQQDRYGFTGPPPFDLGSHELSDGLAQAGWIVMRFDERGFGASEDGVVSYQEQLEDTRRALRTLLVQDEVDPDRIALVGHGEGGWKALQLAGEDWKIRAVALLNSPGRPYEQILQEQSEAAIQKLPPEVQKEARTEQKNLLEALKTGRSVPPELLLQARWLREIMLIRPDNLIAKVDCALWIVQGEKDREIDPRKDPEQLLRHAQKQRKKVKLTRYPDLDHLLRPESDTSASATSEPSQPPVAKQVIEDLNKWLSTQLKQ